MSIISLAVACGAKSHSEVSYKADVDRVIAEHPNSSKQIPPPETLDPKPWRVGQWALYESKYSNGEIGVQRISVVAQDSCGIWIESEAHSYRAHYKWRMCLQPGDVKTSALE